VWILSPAGLEGFKSLRKEKPCQLSAYRFWKKRWWSNSWCVRFVRAHPQRELRPSEQSKACGRELGSYLTPARIQTEQIFPCGNRGPTLAGCRGWGPSVPPAVGSCAGCVAGTRLLPPALLMLQPVEVGESPWNWWWPMEIHGSPLGRCEQLVPLSVPR